MHKSATKCNETLGKWCKNKHGASKIMDTLETYHTSHWYSFILALATRSGAAPYAVNFSSLLNHRRCSVCYVDFDSTYSSSTPKTLRRVDSGPPRRQRHRLQQAFNNIITMIRLPCDSIDRDMQELHLVPSHVTCKTTTSRQDLSLYPIL
jgi:hypothetical protein